MNTPKPNYRVFYFALLTLFFSCKGKKDDPQMDPGKQMQQPALSVEVLLAKPKTLSANIEVPGTILANESTEIHPEVPGRLVQLNVREGNFVSGGSLLAKLYDGDLQAQKQKLTVQLKIAEQTEKRQSELLRIQGISQQDYDLSLLQVYNLKADIDIINEAIKKTEIRAPFPGKLGFKNVSPGAFITPTTIITTISQVNLLKIQFNIPEKYGSQLKNGQQISFTIDGTNKLFTASVLANEGNIEENTRSLAIRALIKNSDPVLIPGAFAKVKVVLGKNENAIMIPNEVILPEGRNKLIYLYKSGKSARVAITTGVRDSSTIQVLSGLNEGDTVISTGLLYLKPDGEVKISKVNGD